jgi:TPP-dependent 2-oxoacid decarboxylase
MSRHGDWTVARYLAARLEQLGIRHVFGVPGNHLGPFISEMRQSTGIAWVGDCNEIVAGSAADGYARASGLGAVGVTYGVGAFSLINTVGGAFVEHVPVVVINAAPTYEQFLNYRSIGLLTSHMTPSKDTTLEAYRQVTVDAQIVSNAAMAPVVIDAALTACLTESRPVYLEVMENVWTSPCAAPKGAIAPRPRPVTADNERMLAGAVTATAALIERFGRPIFWGGVEIQRHGLADAFQRLVDESGIPFCTTIMGKSAVSENHPLFHGVYNGKASLPDVWRMFQEVAGCRIGIGAWSTSKNLGGTRSVGDDWVMASHEGVSVGTQYFPDVQLGRFIPALREALAGRTNEAADYYALGSGEAHPRIESEDRRAFFAGLRAEPPAAAALTYDGFFQRINAFLAAATKGRGIHARNPYVVVSDAGFSLLGSQNLHMVERNGFYSQTSWLSIGYSVGAATGVKAGRDDRRPLVFVGDGSFQETCQALSTQTRLRQDTVVFVLNNEDFYGIEQMLVHPCYFKEGSTEGPDEYNVLHPWNYARLAEVFGGGDTPMTGYVVGTHGELDEVLAALADAGHPANRGPVLVQVKLPMKDYPASIAYPVEACS